MTKTSKFKHLFATFVVILAVMSSRYAAHAESRKTSTCTTSLVSTFNTNSESAHIAASPLGGAVVTTKNGHIYFLGSDGSVQNSLSAGSGFGTPAVVLSDGTAIAPNWDHSIYLASRTSSSVRAFGPLSSDFNVIVPLSDGQIAIHNLDGTFYFIDRGGNELSRFSFPDSGAPVELPNGNLVVLSRSGVNFLDRTGRVLAAYPSSGFGFNTLSVGRTRVAVVGSSLKIFDFQGQLQGSASILYDDFNLEPLILADETIVLRSFRGKILFYTKTGALLNQLDTGLDASSGKGTQLVDGTVVVTASGDAYFFTPDGQLKTQIPFRGSAYHAQSYSSTIAMLYVPRDGIYFYDASGIQLAKISVDIDGPPVMLSDSTISAEYSGVVYFFRLVC